MKPMKPIRRNTSTLSQKEYDLLIVGGGIFGACALWDAASRGLRAALVEKGDFSHGTSANHFKMVHGGIRYLQHADLYRIRESSRERSALLRIAPHMVRPLPIVIPTYGHGIKGKEFLGAGMLLYDLLTHDRNRGLSDGRRIPSARFLSRESVRSLFPGLDGQEVSGAAVFCDGQMYNPPRLALAFIRSAATAGADVANYVKAVKFLKKGNRVCGAQVRDALTGEKFEVRARMILNAAGPWAHHLLESGLGVRLEPKPTFSRDLAFVIRSRINNGHALAVSTHAQDADTLVDRGGRHLFLVPWRDYTLVGVWHVVFNDRPERITVKRNELQGFVDEVNRAYPALGLSTRDILTINTGLTLFGEQSKQGESKMSFGKRSMLVDHWKSDGLQGLVTLIGVRATTARGMAEQTLDLIVRKLDKRGMPCRTLATPIWGGDIASVPDFIEHEQKRLAAGLRPEQVLALVSNYGSHYADVLGYVDENPSWVENFPHSNVLKAEVVHAVRQEMALKLTDVVFRRTELGTGERPAEEVLRECAQIMASDLGWDPERMEEEIRDAQTVFPAITP
jgi:glycerol-3-phosphate dehydrogenase